MEAGYIVLTTMSVLLLVYNVSRTRRWWSDITSLDTTCQSLASVRASISNLVALWILWFCLALVILSVLEGTHLEIGESESVSRNLSMKSGVSGLRRWKSGAFKMYV
tara:strand:- start:1460 stop:1780 length:321 start_codon:yes stop_codon:yes gene_type:complete